MMGDQRKWTKLGSPATLVPHHCCAWRLQQEAAQAGGGIEEDLREAGQGRLQRRCCQEGIQDQVLPAALRSLQEGPTAGGGLGGAEAQVAAQVTEVETARPCKGDVAAY